MRKIIIAVMLCSMAGCSSSMKPPARDIYATDNCYRTIQYVRHHKDDEQLIRLGLALQDTLAPYGLSVESEEAKGMAKDLFFVCHRYREDTLQDAVDRLMNERRSQ